MLRWFFIIFTGDRDGIGDEEGGVKTDPKLPDQGRFVFGILVFLHKSGRATLGNRSKVVDQFCFRHADAFIGDRDRFFRPVPSHPDIEVIMDLRIVR